MYDSVLSNNSSCLKSFYFKYLYFNLTSSDWDFLKSTVFGKNSTLTLLINHKDDSLRFLSVYSLKNVSTFIYTPLRSVIFSRSYNTLLNIGVYTDIKKKVILDSVHFNNNEYSSFVVNSSLSVSKYNILSTFSKVLYLSDFSLFSIIMNLFLKDVFLNILHTTQINTRLIYNLFRYL